MAAAFDAYTATSQDWTAPEVLGWLHCAGDTLTEGKGFHTFAHRVSVKDRTGHEVGAVSHGGRQGARVMVEAKGHRTPGVVEKLRTVPHRVTRVDSCVDAEHPGCFESRLELVTQIKGEHRLYGERRGDWDQPELGRTAYLGAPSSAVRFRLYEKGKQPEYRHLLRPDLVRAEVQVRPEKDAKDAYSRLSATEVWGASPWSRRMALAWLEAVVGAHPPGHVRRETARDRALRFMCGQYAAHLRSLAEDVGSWECLGLTLREMIADEERLRERIRRAFPPIGSD